MDHGLGTAKHPQHSGLPAHSTPMPTALRNGAACPLPFKGWERLLYTCSALHLHSRHVAMSFILEIRTSPAAAHDEDDTLPSRPKHAPGFLRFTPQAPRFSEWTESVSRQQAKVFRRPRAFSFGLPQIQSASANDTGSGAGRGALREMSEASEQAHWLRPVLPVQSWAKRHPDLAAAWKHRIGPGQIDRTQPRGKKKSWDSVGCW